MTHTPDMDRMLARLAILEDCVRVLLESKARGEKVRISLTRPEHMAIIEAVALDHGLKTPDIFRKTSARKIAWPRQVAFLRLRDAGVSLLEIAAIFGVDHTTVMHGVEAAKKRGAE